MAFVICPSCDVINFDYQWNYSPPPTTDMIALLHKKPTVEARVNIWRTMIPDLSEMDAKTLAAKYDFSGGQIENIARHYAIDSILHDAKEDKLAMLINHCDNERLDDNSKKRIGF